MAHFGHGDGPHDDHRSGWRDDQKHRTYQAPNDRRVGGEAPFEGRDRGIPSRDQWSTDRYGSGSGDRAGAYGAPHGRFEDQRGRNYRSHSRSRSRSRSPRRFNPVHAVASDRPPSHRHESRREDGGAPARQWDSQPSATLIVRGLTPNVSDAMIHHAFAPFRPQSTRVMFHKVTGEHRGFAFANFDSVTAATAAMNAFASQPLVLDNQVAVLAYAETNRPSPHGSSHQAGYRDHAPHAPGGGPPRLDWICDQCDSTNFARRTECFKCHASKSPFAMEMPARGDTRPQRQHPPAHYGAHNDNHRRDGFGQSGPPGFDRRDRNDGELDGPPSRVLVVRMIPLDVDEGELQVVFAQYEGVRDIRLIRDRETNQSRGFAFIEFEDIEVATRVLEASGNLLIRGEAVRVGFARETFQSKPTSYRGGHSESLETVAVNPMAAAALERAQWALANNYGGMVQQAETQSFAPAGLDDLDALLGSAAAAARPQIEEPKKPWPLPFETAGGMYRYVSEYGLYYDNDSMFYYDPQSKLYYNSFMGIYYRCLNGTEGAKAVFETFSPPPPCDDAKFSAEFVATHQSTQPPASDVKPVAMTLSKKKTPLISFNLKPSTTAASGKISSAFEAPEALNAPSVTAGPVGSGVSVAAAASASVRKKSAIDIAKWSHRQKEVTEDQAPADVMASNNSAPPSTAPASVASLSAAVDVPLEAPICLLCRRKFASMEQLRKHETLSKLHAENLAKAKHDKEIVGAQIRERDEEERGQLTNKRKRLNGDSAAVAAAPAQAQPNVASQEPAPSALESGIGAKMLKMMGWKQGEGLGKHGTGITAPVEAIGNSGSDTTGLGAKTTPAVDLSKVVTNKERLQKMARARYDGADDHDRKTL